LLVGCHNFVDKIPEANLTTMNNILETWRYSNSSAEQVSIPPDGCIDFIVARPKNYKPYWFVSPLQNAVSTVDLDANEDLMGYRLKAGARIDTRALSKALLTDTSLIRVEEYIQDCCLMTEALESALTVIACGGLSPSNAAHELGITSRTLERLFARSFLPSPSFWCGLARARQAAKSLANDAELADIAFQHGYADQPHLTREFKRWFGVTPHKLKNDQPFLQSILQSGLGTA
jgi:AraC-like DNA-binding protein